MIVSRPTVQNPDAFAASTDVTRDNRQTTNTHQPQQNKRRSVSSESEGSTRQRVDAPRKRISISNTIPRTLPRTATSPSGNQVSGSEQLEPPSWYKVMKKDTSRSNVATGVDLELARLKKLISDCAKAAAGQRAPLSPKEHESIIEAIHKAMFFTVTPKLVRNNFLLHTESGLPVLFHPSSQACHNLPYYINIDAEELYDDWCKEMFEPNLLRGIIVGKGKNAALGRDKGTVDNLDKDYRYRVKGTYFGEKPAEHGQRKILPGEWWPTQLCTVRDGAHNSTIAGISGKSGYGAYSIVISGDEKYPDKDEGDEVWYCGTDSVDGQKTAATQLMVESVNNHPVRVIRSSGAKNKNYAPKAGYRYDGLYEVRGYEILDEEIQRCRFHLVRRPGQVPIRAGDGPESRPTPQEQYHYNMIKSTKVFLA